MCGVAAAVGSFSKERAKESIRAMTKAQQHRGPDDEGNEILETPKGCVALGNRRLAIIDLTPAGHMPMTDDRTGTVLTYNGEIYNFPELRSELSARGHKFSGRGDTEALLLGYREWGASVLERLRGMFAFALWDPRRQSMLLARDHLGIKPLYYATTPDGFLCASELQSLLSSGLIDASLDRRALAGFLAYGSVQEPLTIVEQVRSLGAGSWMEVDASGRITGEGRYWDFPAPDPAAPPERDLIDQGRALLETSVKRHLLSDVPLGVFLSSGIDSTAVAGFAQMASESDVHAFTVSFPEEQSLNELPAARRSADRLGLVFHDIPVDSATALQWADDGLAAMDQPSMDGLNTYIVSRAVREAGLTVALSGQGGDEVFGGYPSFRGVAQSLKLARLGRALPRSLRMALAATAAKPGGHVRSEKARDLAGVSDVADTYFMFRRLMADSDMTALGFPPGSLGLTATFHSDSLEESAWVPGDVVASVSRLESRFYLGNTLLRDGDVFGMANSLEIRVPFLDRDVVDWAYRLPGDVLLPKGAPTKHLLRKMCSDILGPDQLERPKQGFSLPIASWLRGPLATLRKEGLEAAVEAGAVHAEGVRAIEDRYLGDPFRSAWTRVWALVALGRWIQANPAVRLSGNHPSGPFS